MKYSFSCLIWIAVSLSAFAQTPTPNTFKIEQRPSSENAGIKDRSITLVHPGAPATLKLIKEGELPGSSVVPSTAQYTLPDNIKLATLPNGDVFIAWQTDLDKYNWDGKAQALTPSLNPRWGEVVYTDSPDGGGINDQAAVSFSNGVAAVIFLESKDGKQKLQVTSFGEGGKTVLQNPYTLPVDIETRNYLELEAILLPGGLAAMVSYTYMDKEDDKLWYNLEYAVINNKGRILQGPGKIASSTYPLQDVSMALTADDHVLFSYFNIDGRTAKVDPFGQMVHPTEKFTFSQTTIDKIRAVGLDNGSTMVFYREGIRNDMDYKYYGQTKMVILDSKGKILAKPRDITDYAIKDLEVTKMDNGLLFLTAVKNEDNTGYAYLLDQEGTVKHGPVQFCKDFATSQGNTLAHTQLIKGQMLVVYKTQPKGTGTKTKVEYKVFN